MQQNKLYRSRTWLKAQRDKGLTNKQIGEICGVSETTIQNWLVKHKL